MQIFAKTPLGRSVLLTVTAAHTVGEVKKMIQDKEGIPSELQRIVFAGKPLRDGHHLSDYNINREATLHVALPMKGGGDTPV